jgi:sugar lactone lactonase YvrE
MTKTPQLRTLQLAGLVASGLLFLTSARAQVDYATPYTFSTIAGTPGNRGNNDASGAAASFYYPEGITWGTNGVLFTVDAQEDTVRKIAPVGNSWSVTTIAGTAGVARSVDGTNGSALFNEPIGIAADGAGNLYIVDTSSTVRKLTPVGGNWVSTTIAGTPGDTGSNDGTNAAAQFDNPYGIATDAAGNVYVADTENNTIRRLSLSGTNWIVTTIAGDASLGLFGGSADGTNENAEFSFPYSLAVDRSGNVFVADGGNSTVREITPIGTNWVVTTIAGTPGTYNFVDGTNAAAAFDSPFGITVDSRDNVYVSDTDNNAIREVSPIGTNWVVTTLAGAPDGSSGTNNGTGSTAQFNDPWGITVDAAGNVYVADTSNSTIREGTIAVAGNLTISLIGQNNVLVSWPGSGVLQTNANLASPNWVNYGGAMAATNGINSVTFAPPLVGNLFFRLTN